MARRLSLTKKQRATAAGLDLIALCQTAGANGRLSDEEIEALREWTETYQGVDLPAREHLASVLTKVLADGAITPAERSQLYDSVEKVLPPDVRETVHAPRRALMNSGYDFMVAGVRYEERFRACDCMDIGDEIVLAREPDNPYSPNATIVLGRDCELGYVPEVDAIHLAPQLDGGCRYVASVKKVLRGGRWPIPVVIVVTHNPDAGIEWARAPLRRSYRERANSQTQSVTGLSSARQGSELSQRSGCSLVLIALATAAIAGLLSI